MGICTSKFQAKSWESAGQEPHAEIDREQEQRKNMGGDTSKGAKQPSSLTDFEAPDDIGYAPPVSDFTIGDSSENDDESSGKSLESDHMVARGSHSLSKAVSYDDLVLKKMEARRAVFSKGLLEGGSGSIELDPLSCTKNEATKGAIDQVLQKCYLFSDLLSHEREVLIRYLKEERVPVGDTVVHQGAVGSRFYVIQQGCFQILEDNKPVAVISGAPEEETPYFGEVSLLFGTQQTSTIKCVATSNSRIHQDSAQPPLPPVGLELELGDAPTPTLPRIEVVDKHGNVMNRDGDADATGIDGDVKDGEEKEKRDVEEKEAVLWGINRATFRHVMAETMMKTRNELRSAVESIPLIKDYLNADQMERVIDCIEFVYADAGTQLVRKGDKGTVCYFIKEGKVECTSIGENGLGRLELGAGSHFGERALIKDEPRAANVKAITDVVLLALDGDSFNELFGSMRTLMDHTMKKRVIESISIFQQFSPTERKDLITKFKTEFFEPGQTIIQQGDKGDRFYVVRSGEVEVLRDGPLEGKDSSERKSWFRKSGSKDSDGTSSKAIGTTAQKIALIKESDWFGEMALIGNTNRYATCRAVGLVECFTLHRDDFDVLRQNSQLLLKTNEIRLKALDLHGGKAEDQGSYAHQKVDSEDLRRKERKVVITSLAQLEQKAILGKGTFGTVYLVKCKGKSASHGVWALKMMNKKHLIECEQTKNVFNEKLVLEEAKHPFIIELHATFSDSKSVYMLLDFVQGGELFTIMQEKFRLSISHTKFYSACIVDVFEYLHSRKIVYRDLKPENVLIDKQGYIKLADFGFAKKIVGKTYTLCGTPEYLAPEVVLGKGHDKGVDYWGVGILIYEMLAGISPFADEYGEDQILICKNIVSGKPDYNKLDRAIRDTESQPNSGSTYVISQQSPLGKNEPRINGRRPVEDLLRRILVKLPHQRLGCLKNRAADIKQHPFYAVSIPEWKDLTDKVYPAPYVPRIRSEMDISHFERYDFSPTPWPKASKRGSDRTNDVFAAF